VSMSRGSGSCRIVSKVAAGIRYVSKSRYCRLPVTQISPARRRSRSSASAHTHAATLELLVEVRLQVLRRAREVSQQMLPKAERIQPTVISLITGQTNAHNHTTAPLSFVQELIKGTAWAEAHADVAKSNSAIENVFRLPSQSTGLADNPTRRDGTFSLRTCTTTGEDALSASARILNASKNAPEIRPPGADLDARQRQAYAHLATERQVAIVTGAANPGKLRLQQDLSAAYTEAGARVIRVSVSESPRMLGAEADIFSCTVSKLLSDLKHGREQLDSRDVLLIDEAETIGTKQAKRLFKYAATSGATVRLLSDKARHNAARGGALRGLVNDLGAYDMTGYSHATT
jgi:hypothetical protein